MALIIIGALIANSLFEKIKIPGILGMIAVGIICGPYGKNYIPQEIIDISPDLRVVALIVILIRAGLGIKRETLNKVGKPAALMSFIPGLLKELLLYYQRITF